MEQQLMEKLAEQDQKLEAIYTSVEKTRKYFLWTMVATLITFILPLIGLIIAIPWFLGTLSDVYTNLGI